MSDQAAQPEQPPAAALEALASHYRRAGLRQAIAALNIIGDVRTKLDSLGTAAGGLTAITAVVGLATKAFKAMREEAQLIEDLTVKAEDLQIDPNTLQVFELAAERANLAQGEFTGGLQRMQKLIGEAELGTESAAKTFEKLGLDSWKKG